jgi:ERCC4-type nuclease
MKIICDERESSLYFKIIELNNSQNPNLIIEKKVLHLGDVIIENDNGDHLLLIERKTFSDLFASIYDGRYDEQSYRLINCGEYHTHNIIYLIEGVMNTLNSVNDQNMFYSTITSINQFKGFSIMRTANLLESANYILRTAIKMSKELEKGKKQKFSLEINSNEINQQPTEQNYCSVVSKVKKDNITPKNIGEIILCQIPGISSLNAISIMKDYDTFKDFYEAVKLNPELLDELSIESNGKKRKINKNIINNIKTYLF